MGSVFKRGDSKFWWLGFTDATGRRRNISSNFENREAAEKMLRGIERRVQAEREQGFVKGPLTVAQYAAKWLDARRERDVGSVEEDEDRMKHALRFVGRMALKDVRHRHMRDMVRQLVAKKELAPRTIRHVYSVMRIMFAEAVADELIPGTPCTLNQYRGELPPKQDKNPNWRDTAIFTRDEVELILSDERIPAQRRMLYGFLFLAGLRINEVTPRRWKDYDPRTEPLGKLTVGYTYVLKKKAEKQATKSGFSRYVPVHPTLAKMLAEWRLNGWAKFQKRQPTPDDLIVPAPLKGKRGGGVLNSNSSLLRFHEDLRTLGLRERRQHDARRTFVSLGLDDGARPEILRWVSHGPTGEVFDLYTTLSWKTLCDEVSRLNVRLLTGKVVQLPHNGATA